MAESQNSSFWSSVQTYTKKALATLSAAAVMAMPFEAEAKAEHRRPIFVHVSYSSGFPYFPGYFPFFYRRYFNVWCSPLSFFPLVAPGPVYVQPTRQQPAQSDVPFPFTKRRLNYDLYAGSITPPAGTLEQPTRQPPEQPAPQPTPTPPAEPLTVVQPGLRQEEKEKKIPPEKKPYFSPWKDDEKIPCENQMEAELIAHLRSKLDPEGYSIAGQKSLWKYEGHDFAPDISIFDREGRVLAYIELPQAYASDKNDKNAENIVLAFAKKIQDNRLIIVPKEITTAAGLRNYADTALTKLIQ